MKLNVAWMLPLAALMLMGSDCRKNKDGVVGPDPNASGDHLWPLEVGNHWVFQVTEYADDGSVDSTYVDTIYVREAVTMDGVVWYRIIQTSYKEFAEFFPIGGANLSDGVYSRLLSDSAGAPELIYKYPSSVGDTFGDPSAPTLVYQASASLDVGGTTYTVWSFRETTPDGFQKIENHLAPGVGPVRTSVSVMRSGEFHVRQQADLVQASVK